MEEKRTNPIMTAGAAMKKAAAGAAKLKSTDLLDAERVRRLEGGSPSQIHLSTHLKISTVPWGGPI